MHLPEPGDHLGVVLAASGVGLHLRKFSIFEDLGASGWGVAVSTVFAAGFFANVLTLFLVTPYNVPIDWTVAILYGVVFSVLGVLFFAVGYREMLRVGRRKKLNTR